MMKMIPFVATASVLLGECLILIASQSVSSSQQHPAHIYFQQRQQHHHHHWTRQMQQQQEQEQEHTSTSTSTSTASNNNNQSNKGRGGNDRFSKLRQYLLQNYDRYSYPFEDVQYVNETDGTVRGLDVEMSINFHKIREVDVVGADADLIVWFRLSWYDHRLAWNNNDDNNEFENITSINFRIESGSGSSETSEIWVPEMYLWNAQEPISKTLDDSNVIVYSDGFCFWSRPGHIIAACKYQGLNDFPFDDLSCDLEFGTWTYSGKYIFPIQSKSDGGVSLGGSETAGQTYSEFHLADVTTREHIYPPYPAAPDENWPVIFYTLHFSRAWQPYVRGYILFQILMNLMAFCCFWLSPICGERLGLAITSMLAAIAGELIVTTKIPPSGERSWYTDFSIVSVAFNAIVVFESAIVIYFYYYSDDTIIPDYVSWMINKVKKIRLLLGTAHTDGSSKITQREQKGGEDFDCNKEEGEEEEGNTEKNHNNMEIIPPLPLTAPAEEEDGGPYSSKQLDHAERIRSDGIIIPEDKTSKMDVSWRSHDMNHRQPKESSSIDNSLRSYELNMAPMATRRRFHSSASSRFREPPLSKEDEEDEEDRRTQKSSFNQKTEEEVLNNNIKWQKTASRIDDICRLTIPSTYIVLMAIILQNASSSP